ncbi:Phage P22-like portal protein [uncultured Caudovirales phage]|uniref:Phage P22-like portal protein n=1 Tax=uncultured Caudovirales phage TaxID=2100421 RepID=A0A6J5NPJ0_9CAUD|nr:Phage P22-like portal protein [uncultured Caudovirales phage]CAB4160682.1 Phage P22-like portal protein [uncultured Caudovirales phage]
MARISKEQRLANLHAEALSQFDNVQTALRDERLQCLQDRRFYSLVGAQWEGPLWDIYENKPKFEVNKIALAVMRIISEYRNNRITVDFVSKDGAENDKLADTCDGLYRADEHDSVANEAYDNAFEEAVGGGFGAWRLRTTYEDDEDEDNERQRIQIEPIFDADSSVFFDLNAKRQDKADARFCYVIYSMTYESYKEEWNDDPTDWPKIIHQYEFDWCTPDVVYIAEYYKVEDVTETIRIFRAIDGTEERYKSSEFTDDPALEETLAAIGSVEVRQRKIKSRKVHKYIMSGGRILEDAGYIAGKCIPIVPVYGKRWFVDNVERCMGHVRLAKDAQRLKNMQLSKLGEISALSSVEKPILTPEQIAGHQLMWAEDNLKDYPYLLINPITNADGSQAISGPVAYTRSPAIPPAMAALLQVTEQDMQDILGNPQAGEKVVSNVSGKAVEMIQQRLDMQTFIYMSNFAKAMKRCGEIWLSMAKDVYVEEGRQMKVITDNGDTDSVTLMQPTIDQETGEVKMANDLGAAKFDVDVDVGPSSSSKRAATVRALTGMMQITQDPETLQVLGAMAMMNMEGEGVGDVQDYFRKRLIRMGVVKPTDAEAEALMAEMQAAGQQQDPNAIFLQAAAEEAVAKAAKARADTVETIASAELKRAQTSETIAKASEIDQNIALTTIEALEQAAIGEQVQPVVR